MRIPPEVLPLFAGRERLLEVVTEDQKPAVRVRWSGKLWQIVLRPDVAENEALGHAAVLHGLAHFFGGHGALETHACSERDCLYQACEAHANMLSHTAYTAMRDAGIEMVDPIEVMERARVSVPHWLPIHEALHDEDSETSDGNSGMNGCGGIEGGEGAASAAAIVSALLSAGREAEVGSAFGHLVPMRRRVPEWVRLLRRFVTSEVKTARSRGFRMSRPRRVPRRHGMLIPSFRTLYRPEPRQLIFLVDTSGSMWDANVMGHIAAAALHAVHSGLRVRLIAGDTAVTMDEEIGTRFPPLIGGGGTDLRPLFERASEYEPSAMVVLTDCYVPVWPMKPQARTLFVVPPSGANPPAWADEIVHMREE